MQSGFRAGYGCNSATLKVLNAIITSIDKRHYCAAVFINLAKALDSVNHYILIGRLNRLGLSNDCLGWFTNYFSGRDQCFKSEGLLSGSFYGGATGFKSRDDSPLYTSIMPLFLLVIV